MDDNAHPHRAAIVDDFLESDWIERMEWPAYSPDLNPIENLWDALGRTVCRRFPPPATLRDLKTALQEEWRLLDSAVVDHLVTSMITRKGCSHTLLMSVFAVCFAFKHHFVNDANMTSSYNL
ncbi:hypothetical protein AVEN_187179-1 [Araneus ventricosus]|uniref:Tc1-like transposase DDE domain-containing protein n=1 Tax=Araneus ventricosus TaxID=182803 RepID=A0A4Y2JHQ0_ARAVE|nr:hypothetical protein AVEN_187179-1 [Araneus ventricosus]